MGWAEDHRKAVALRWREKYIFSGFTAAEFTRYMTDTMRRYGWSEDDIKIMLKIAIKKEDA